MRLNLQEEFSWHNNNGEGNTLKQFKIIFTHLTWTHYIQLISLIDSSEKGRKNYTKSYLPIF